MEESAQGAVGCEKRCTEGATTNESDRGAVGCEKRHCHEGEPAAGASVSCHSSDRSGSDDRDEGKSDVNGPNH